MENKKVCVRDNIVLYCSNYWNELSLPTLSAEMPQSSKCWKSVHVDTT